MASGGRGGNGRRVGRKSLTEFFVMRQVVHPDGTRSWVMIDSATGLPYERVSRWLRGRSEETQRTYGYHVLDHLGWTRSLGRQEDDMTFADLQRYVGLCGATMSGPLGTPWLTAPLADGSLKDRATALKSYYLHWMTTEKVQSDLVEELRTFATRSSAQAHSGQTEARGPVPPNPLRMGGGGSRPTPKLMDDSVSEALLRAATTARDRMILCWFEDSGIRIGQLAGLQFPDLHLVMNHPCRDMAAKHAHVVHRDSNPNGARSKGAARAPRSGVVRGGLLVRVSSRMLDTYHEYLLTDYERWRAAAQHDMVLIQLRNDPGAPLSPKGIRALVNRLAKRSGVDKAWPHQFRHLWATRLLEETDGNAVLVAQVGGWKSPQMVEDTYGHLTSTSAAAKALDTVHKKNADRIRKAQEQSSGASDE